MMRTAILALLLCSALPGADLSGVWVVRGSPDIAANPAYTPEFQKLWQERKKDLKETDPATYCLPNGAVRVTNLPYKIVQTDKLVVILSEGNTHSFRRVFLDGRPHNLDLEPETWTGDSTGKWDGEVLVVDTIGLNDRTWLDTTGKPHSEALHVVERYRRVSPTRLEVQYTLDDAKAFTKPFSFTRSFELVNRDLQEQFCTHLNHLESKK
jgi:hypothetical protein